MMALLFLFLLVIVLVSWAGYRRTAIVLFFIVIILGALWFNHHVTEALNIDL